MHQTHSHSYVSPKHLHWLVVRPWASPFFYSCCQQWSLQCSWCWFFGDLWMNNDGLLAAFLHERFQSNRLDMKTKLDKVRNPTVKMTSLLLFQHIIQSLWRQKSFYHLFDFDKMFITGDNCANRMEMHVPPYIPTYFCCYSISLSLFF